MTAFLPDSYELTDEPARIDPVAAHAFLKDSYWAKDILLETVARSIAGSMTVAVFHDEGQVAMARIISDEATFAYLTDVYVLEAHRGKGLSKAMLRHFLDHPRLKGVLRWALFTKDAQALYRQFGFFEYPMPDRMMVIDKRLSAG
jgi:GNAT superfamily N-acetyltransferase